MPVPLSALCQHLMWLNPAQTTLPPGGADGPCYRVEVRLTEVRGSAQGSAAECGAPSVQSPGSSLSWGVLLTVLSSASSVGP